MSLYTWHGEIRKEQREKGFDCRKLHQSHIHQQVKKETLTWIGNGRVFLQNNNDDASGPVWILEAPPLPHSSPGEKRNISEELGQVKFPIYGGSMIDQLVIFRKVGVIQFETFGLLGDFTFLWFAS